MNGCKVYQMPTNMADQHIKENTQRRLHMPKMHSTKARKIKRAIIKATILFIKSAIKLGISVIAAWVISFWAIPAAYAQRGYKAVGGEWILIIAAFGFTYWLLTKYTSHKERRF